MHLLTILAFAFVFWQDEQPGRWAIVGPEDVARTLAVVLAQPVVFGLAATLAARRALNLLRLHPQTPEIAQRFHHRATVVLQAAVGIGFGAAVFLTRWPGWFAFARIAPGLGILGDLIVVLPFVANVLILWIAAYPLERAIHAGVADGSPRGDSDFGPHWRFWSYMDFHLRHYVLVVAAPMSLVLFSADLTRAYTTQLREWTGWVWTPDAILGIVAVGVFVTAPIMLRRIWHTAPLEHGEIRSRLEETCRRIDLRCRDILIWNSDGMMINAAVMGVFAPLRFVMLSDALLATMTVRQVEAVFGHEAGHVKHRHIQHLLVFAFVGWLIVAGVMELTARLLLSSALRDGQSVLVIEGAGVLTAAVLWGAGFGWLSRRFERQADLFGAHCVTPSASDCTLPCSVHPDAPSEANEQSRGRGVCATGAALFASALDRVAVLNGIPHEERSWRHSSIGSRIRFLAALAGDPNRTHCFERTMRRLKMLLKVLAVAGLAVSVYYWVAVPEPAILELQARVP